VNSEALMKLRIFPGVDAANAAAGEWLAGCLAEPSTSNVMVAGGNTPLPVYELIARRRLDLAHLNLFVLDEYVGVPLDEPRSCANLLRQRVAHPWGVAPERFFAISSLAEDALASVIAQEQRIERAGGLDLIILGLGQNGHLGFNEPGSAPDSTARITELDPLSTEANRRWFGGDYAPSRGATVGLKTILAARKVLVLAYGSAKAAAVRQVVAGEIGSHCPASFLRTHPDACLIVDQAAAAALSPGYQALGADFQEVPLVPKL